MPDEAILRIIMQDGGGGDAPSRQDGQYIQSTQQSTPQPRQRTAEAQSSADRYLEAEAKAALVIVRNQQELENRRIAAGEAAIRAEMDRGDKESKLLELESQATLDVIRRKQASQDAREHREQQLLEVEARAHLDVVRKQQKALTLDVEPVFDPYAEAEKRRESERQKALVDDAYKQQYGNPNEKGTSDEIVKALESLRGYTLRMLLGPFVGGLVDIMAHVLKTDTGVAKEKFNQDLLTEAKATLDDPIIRAYAATSAGAEPLVEVLGAKSGKPYPGYHEVTANTATAGVIPKAPAGEPPVKSSGAGGLSSMVTAAGPVALIAMAAKAINDAVIGGVKGVIGGAGGVLKDIASPESDPAVALEGLGNAVSKAGEALFTVAPEVLMFGEGLKALAGVMQALDKMADRYGEYSPQIALAQGQVEVRHVMGDLRRSREIDEEMSRYVYAKGKLMEQFEDVKIKLLEKILPTITSLVELMSANVTAAEKAYLLQSIIAEAATGQFEKAVEDFKKLIKDQNKEESKDPTEILLQKMVWAPEEGPSR